MQTNRFSVLLGSLLLLLLGAPAVLTITACGTPGERARVGCPAGEVCNPETPNGLRFYGSSIGGTLTNTPNPVAVGGHESIRFEDAVSSLNALPLHHVVSSAPGVVSADSRSQRTASLRGVSAGSAELRVLDSSDRLIDRISVGAAQIARIEIVQTGDLLIALAPGPAVPVVFAAGEANVGVALLSAAGTRLVDDEMQITSTASISPLEWDAVQTTFDAADVPLTVMAGGTRFEAVAHHAGAIDDFELVSWILPMDDMSRPFVGAGDSLCVLPRSGGARVVGFTQTLTFSVDGHATPASNPSNCVALPAGLGTSVVVQVSFGAATRSFTLAVDPGRTSPAPLLAVDFALPRIVSRTLGARARLSWGLPAAD